MPYINVDEVYILDNTGLQVDMATDIPFADAGFSDDQKAQARKNIAAGGTNPNLLDNPFFQVNQRGATTVSASNAYIGDRWKVSGNTYTWTYGRAALSLTNSQNSLAYLVQAIETDLSNDLNGKTVTFSVKLDGTVYHTTFTWDKSARNSAVTIPNLADVFFWYGANGEACIRFTAGGTWTINAVKLELGTVSTLANDAPPDYGTELAKCQRYCIVLDDIQPFAFGYFVGSGSQAYLMLPLPVTMRAKPTVTITGSLYLRWLKANGTVGSNSTTSVTIQAVHPNGVIVVANATGDATFPTTSYISGKMTLSADL